MAKFIASFGVPWLESRPAWPSLGYGPQLFPWRSLARLLERHSSCARRPLERQIEIAMHVVRFQDSKSSLPGSETAKGSPPGSETAKLHCQVARPQRFAGRFQDRKCSLPGSKAARVHCQRSSLSGSKTEVFITRFQPDFLHEFA